MFTSIRRGNTQPVLKKVERLVTQEMDEKIMTPSSMEEIEIAVKKMNRPNHLVPMECHTVLPILLEKGGIMRNRGSIT